MTEKVHGIYNTDKFLYGLQDTVILSMTFSSEERSVVQCLTLCDRF